MTIPSKRLITVLKRNSIAYIGVLVSTLFVVGCATTKENTGAVSDSTVQTHSQTSELTESQKLYKAVLQTFENAKLMTALRDDGAKIIVSKWVDVGDKIRHRFTVRVKGFPSASGRGEQVALYVRSEYQIRKSVGGSDVWVDTNEDKAFQRRATSDEAKFGKTIQNRYKELTADD